MGGRAQRGSFSVISNEAKRENAVLKQKVFPLYFTCFGSARANSD